VEKTISKVLILTCVLMVALAVVPWILAVIDIENSGKLKYKKYVLPEISLGEDIWDGDFSESLARPLFWVQRRPIEPAKEVEVTPIENTASSSLQFMGFLMKDDLKQVWIKVDGTVSAVQEGQEIAGWIVIHISDGSAVLVRGKEKLILPESQAGSDRIKLHRLD